MSSDPLLAIPEIDPNQTGKTITLNQAIVSLAQSQAGTLTLAANSLTSPYTIPFTASGDEPAVVKTALRFVYLNVTGAIGADWTAYVPGGGYQHVFFAANNTTGGHNVIVVVSGQTGVTIPAGQMFICYLNGTDVVQLSPVGGAGTYNAGTGLTLSGSTFSVTASGITNALLAQMAGHTFKGNNTGSPANALDLTATQLTAELNAVVGDSGSGGTKGMVPAPGAGDAAAGKFLKADGTFAVPPGTGGSGTVTSVATGTGLTGGTITTSGTVSLAAIANNDVLANTSGSSAAPVPTTLTALLDAALGNAQGDILYRGASSWAVLAPGTSGYVLQTGGASANPSWVASGGGGSSAVDYVSYTFFGGL